MGMRSELLSLNVFLCQCTVIRHQSTASEPHQAPRSNGCRQQCGLPCVFDPRPKRAPWRAMASAAWAPPCSGVSDDCTHGWNMSVSRAMAARERRRWWRCAKPKRGTALYEPDLHLTSEAGGRALQDDLRVPRWASARQRHSVG